MKTSALHRFLHIGLLLGLLTSTTVANEIPERVVRFEQMLLRSPGPGSAFDEVRSHLQREQNLSGLRERWEEALLENPEEAATYHFLLGLLADQKRQPREARNQLERATEINSRLGSAWSALADLLLREGALREAVDAYEKALEQPLSPNEEQEILLALGRAHLRQFNTEAAVDTWKTLREKYSDDPFVLEEIGEALVQAGAFEEARETLRLLIDNPHTDPFRRLQSRLWVADTHLRQGQWDEALAGYRAVFRETQPGSWLQRQALSKVEELFFRRGQSDELLNFYRESLEESRNLYLARRLQQLYTRLQQPEEANDLLRQMARWAPDDSRVQADRAHLHQAEGEWEAAETIFLTLTRRHPQTWSYRENLGSLYLERARSGDRQRAAEAWAELAPDDLTDPGPIVRLGDLYRRYQWNEEALEAYQRALSLESRDFALREKTALFLFDLERHDEGWEILRGSGEALPSASNYQRLARLEYRHDLVGEALESIRRGLALDENHFPLLRFKWQIHSEQENWEEALALIPAMQENLPSELHQPNLDRLHRLTLERTDRLEEKRESLRANYAQAIETETPMPLGDLRFYLYLEGTEKDLPEITEILQQGLAWHPEAFPLVHQQWELARAANDLELQESSLRSLIELRPSRTGEWLRHLSQAMENHGQRDRAREVAREWIAYQPADSNAHLHLAGLYYDYSQPEQGNQIIQQALALATDTVPLRRRLAEALSRQGRMEEALEAHRENFQTLTSRSDRLGLVPQMVEVYRRGGFSEPMVEWFNRHFPDLRETADGHLFRGEIFLEQEDYTAARQELERAWALEPSNLNIADSLIRLALEEENYEEAVRHGRDAFALDSSVENEMRLANLLLRTEDTEEAFAIIARNGEHFVRETEEWPEFFNLLRTNTNRDQLVRIIQNHLSTAEEPYSAQTALAEFFIERGDFAKAGEMLWEIYQLEPKEDIGISTGGGLWGSMYDSGVFAEYQITRQAVETFASRIINNHPLYQRRHHHSHYHRFHHGQMNLDDINIYRSKALGYLVAIAVVNNQEEDFIQKWNEILRDQPAHRIMMEKVKVDHFDDVFLATLQSVAAGELSLHPHWEDSLYQLLQIYSMQGLFTSLPEDKEEMLIDAMTEWGQRTRSEMGGLSTMIQLQEWWQQLELSNFNRDKETVFFELDEFIAELGDDPDMLFHLGFLAVTLALGYEDFEQARLRMNDLEGYNAPFAIYYQSEILSQGLQALAELNRPLEEVEMAFLRELLGKDSFTSSPYGRNFPHHLDVNELQVPFNASELIPSGILNQLQNLRNSQERWGEPLDWTTLLRPDKDEEISPAEERSLRTLDFFFALWEEDFTKAKTLGQNILATGEDAGVRLNLAFLEEKEGNIRQAITLLDGAQMNRNEWFGSNQWKIIQLASTDEELYPIGQMAVRRLARNWNQHRHRLPDSLEELHRQVGMAEEWERRQQQQQALEEATSEPTQTPHWQVLRKEWKEAEDPERKTSLAKEILQHAPLGYRDPTVRQNRARHYARTAAIRDLRQAKQESLRHLHLQETWEDYIAELRQRAEDNPSSLEALARVIEALEFSHHHHTHRHGTAHPRTPEEEPRVEMRLLLNGEQLGAQDRPLGQDRWRRIIHLQHEVHPFLIGREVKVGILLSGGDAGQQATIQIENAKLITTDGEEIPLKFRPLTPDNEGDLHFSFEETEEGQFLLSSDGGVHARGMTPHGLFLGATTDRFAELRFTYNPLQSTENNGGHHGLMLKTRDEEGDQVFFYSAHVHGDRMYTYTEVNFSVDPAPYYQKALALRPGSEYLRESFIDFLYRQERFDDLIEAFGHEVTENPYLVLRGDNSQMQRAFDRTGRIPALVDEFLQNPALYFNLSKLTHHQNQLGQILADVGDNLAEMGYPVEAARVRSVALEILPVTETMDARLSLLKALSEEGQLETAQSLLYGFFETSKENEGSQFLMSQRHRFEPEEGNWLDHFEAWHHFSGNKSLPYPFQLMQAAHPEVSVTYRDLWRERQPDFPRVEDPADALLGTILHWALLDADFPQSLLATAERFGPSARLSAHRKEWFVNQYQFPLLESLDYFSPDEEIREAIHTAFSESSGGRRGGMMQRMFGGGSSARDAFLKYRTDLLIKGMDYAWQHQEEVFAEALEGQRHLPSNRQYYLQHLLREAANRMDPDSFDDLLQRLMNTPEFTRHARQKNALLWEKERQNLRRGEVRKPYVTAFWLPQETLTDDPTIHYAISGVHPEDIFHETTPNRRRNWSWFYGENFPLLDEKFDLVITYGYTGNDSGETQIVLSKAPASGKVTLSDAASVGNFSLTLKDPESGETVYEVSIQNRPMRPGPSILPPLLSDKDEQNELGITWEWLGTPPRKDSIHALGEGYSVYFAGYGNDDQEIARTSLIPLGDARRVTVQGLIKHRATHPSPFSTVFYNEKGEEIFERSTGIQSNPERWMIPRRGMVRATAPTPGRDQIPREATHVRLIIRANAPINIAELDLMFSPE